MKIQQINLNELEANPFQHRRIFSQAEMDELTESIREHGVLQAILVRPIRKKTNTAIKFQVVAGERRFRAATAAGLRTIPATVKEVSDLEALTIALVENIQREDPDDWATATGIKSMMEMSAANGEPLTELAVARRLKKSAGFVRNHLGLFKLRPQLQEVAQERSNVKSSLFEIAKVKDPEAEADLIAAVRSGASFQAVKARVDEYLKHEEWQKESRKQDGQDAARSAENDRSGGGNMSRGFQVRGVSVAEANQSLEISTMTLGQSLKTVEMWAAKAAPTKRIELAPQYKELAQKLLRLAGE